MNYGIIGNCQSACLVSGDSTMSFLCLPRFDSPAVFSKILDSNKGGYFQVILPSLVKTSQKYLQSTNILKTNLKNKESSLDIIDFMPRYKDDKIYNPAEVVRSIRPSRKNVMLKIRMNPRMGFGKSETRMERDNNCLKIYEKKNHFPSYYLYSNVGLFPTHKEQVIVIQKEVWFLLSTIEKRDFDVEKYGVQSLKKTTAYWRSWAKGITYTGPLRETVERSSLVLKLLSFETSGAMIAAPTTSLPEIPGENRNWDYRYCWLRDSCMSATSLEKAGRFKSKLELFNFFCNHLNKDSDLKVMYTILGSSKIKEVILTNLDGYKNSKPVRVGNEAYSQSQHDNYGFFSDFLYDVYMNPKSSHDMRMVIKKWLTSISNHVINSWQNPDSGIWEFRNIKKHFVLSKVMCWVALDRCEKILINCKDDFSYKLAKEKDKIKESVFQNGWCEKISSFSQYYGSCDFDASNLLMGHLGFIDKNDSRYVDTVMNTYKNLCKNGLTYRYLCADDFGLPKTSFTICSYWMVSSLCLIGEKKKAEKIMKVLLSYQNHLGLMSEGIDCRTGELVGNFPQGYSHLGLIEACLQLAD